LYFKTGVEKEDYEASMMHFLKTDPEVKTEYMDYMKEMDAMSKEFKGYQ
jgi:hypothetical protein